MSQVAAASTVLGRGIPMIFMGQEAGELMQFGQDDGKLRDYNPGTGQTWWDDCLDLGTYETDAGRTKVRRCYTRMFESRKSDPEGFASPDSAITHMHDDNGGVAFT